MNKHKRNLILLFICVALVAFIYLGDLLTLTQIQQYQQHWQHNVAQSPWQSSALFFLVYFLITALSIPGALLLTLLGAALFGFWWSLVLISFASSLGATAAFLVSRYLLRSWVGAKFGHRLMGIESQLAKQGDLYLFSLRLIPVVPFFLINLLMGLTQFPVRRFYWISQLGMLAGTAVYINVGTQLSQLTSLDGLVSPEILCSLALLAVFPWIAKYTLQKLKTQRQMRLWSKPNAFDYNLIVIGGGAGGLVSSYLAAKSQAKVLLIERDKMGGDCLNTGCVPSKSLLHLSKTGYAFTDAMAKLHQNIATIAPNDSQARYQSLGVTCLTGTARFVTPWQVQVGAQTFTAKKIILATGGKPRLPNIQGLEKIPYATSETLWQTQALPKRLLVLGGGPMGCELAQAFAQFGSQVTLIDKHDQILPKEDAQAAEIVAKHLQQLGVILHLNQEICQLESSNGGYTAILNDGTSMVFDLLLIAIGRTANVEHLGIETIQLEQTDHGTIQTDAYLRTNIPHIFAVGDVTNGPQLTHSAAHQAGYAFFNGLFGFKKRKVNNHAMPRITYTTPELAQVGLTESQAKAKYANIEITHFPFSELDRAIVDDATDGFVKVMSLKQKIVGVTIVGAHAGEMLAEFTLAMTHGLTLKHILNTVHPYPSYSDANKLVAGKWQSKHIPNAILPWLGRFHRWQRGEKTSAKELL